MKFWRRHKHELTHSDADAPLPQPPDKKMRYSREDDILLAKYFYDKPEGTSDSIFQAFGRQVRRFLFFVGAGADGGSCGVCSTRITRGRGGKSIIGSIRRRLTISWRC